VTGLWFPRGGIDVDGLKMIHVFLLGSFLFAIIEGAAVVIVKFA
jgi:hypothetical protein